MRYLVSIVVLFVLMSGANSYAASFDCNKASNSLEITICKTSDLNTEDAKLGTLFQNAKGKISKYHFKEFLQEHRAWLKSRLEHCKVTDTQCLVRLYTDRNEELQKLNDFLNSIFKNLLGMYRLNTKDDCQLELILFEHEGSYRYQLILDGNNRLGNFQTGWKSYSQIYLEGVESSDPSTYTLSLATHLNSLSFTNYGNAMNPYAFFEPCGAKHILLEKVKETEKKQVGNPENHLTSKHGRKHILGPSSMAKGLGFINFDKVTFGTSNAKFRVFEGPSDDFSSHEIDPYRLSNFDTLYEAEMPIFEQQGDWLLVVHPSQWVSKLDIGSYSYSASWRDYFSKTSQKVVAAENVVAYPDQILLNLGPDQSGAIDTTRNNWLLAPGAKKDQFVSTKGKHIVILKTAGDYALVKLEDGPVVFDCTYEGPEYVFRWQGEIGWIRYIDKNGYPYIKVIRDETIC